MKWGRPQGCVARAWGRCGLASAVVLQTFVAAHAEIAPPPPGATSCMGCHAARPGVETPVPRIAGRPAAEITTALAAFRSGTRTGGGTIMNRIAKGFTPEESAAIAAWYATRKD